MYPVSPATSRHWLRSCHGLETQSAGVLVAHLFATDEGASARFLCSRPGGDVVSNFRPLLPPAVGRRRPGSFLNRPRRCYPSSRPVLVGCRLSLLPWSLEIPPTLHCVFAFWLSVLLACLFHPPLGSLPSGWPSLPCVLPHWVFAFGMAFFHPPLGSLPSHSLPVSFPSCFANSFGFPFFPPPFSTSLFSRIPSPFFHRAHNKREREGTKRFRPFFFPGRGCLSRLESGQRFCTFPPFYFPPFLPPSLPFPFCSSEHHFCDVFRVISP